MLKKKKNKLIRQGWKVGDAKQFLELSDEEQALVEFKLALADALKMHRTKKKMSQMDLAKHLSSSQSRVAKMEAADASVSVDLLLRALLKLGASNKQIALAIAQAA